MSALTSASSFGPIPATVSVHWGVVYISLTNLLIIALMVVVFVLALVLPFPHAREPQQSAPGSDDGHQPHGEQS